MKSISGAMRTELDGDGTTLASCWHITRRDGTEFFFTTHDQELVIDGDTYTPETAYNRTSVNNSENLAVDGTEVAGMMDSEQLDENDFRNGLFDGAYVEYFLVDWENLANGRITLRTGTLGEVRLTEKGFFFAELRGLMQYLSTKIVELATAECRAQFGDARCKVPVAPPVWSSGIDLTAERWPSSLATRGDYEFRVPNAGTVTDWVSPSAYNDRVFMVTTGGRTNPVEPTWNTTVDGATTQPWSGFDAWAATTAYVVGDVVRASASPTDKLFVCTTAGTSGGTEPTWNTTVDATTADGTVVWTTYPLPPEWETKDAYTKEGAVDGSAPFTPNQRTFQVLSVYLTQETGYYNWGILEWTSGPNNGRRHEIKDWINASGVYVENASPNLDFIQQAGDDVARRDAGSWIDDGFTPGMRLSVSGSPAQDGTYLVISVTALDLVISGDWPAQNLNTTGSSITGILKQITLNYEKAAFEVSDADTFTVYPGCQRRITDCKAFLNIINKRSEDYLPGNDKRFAYPNARA